MFKNRALWSAVFFIQKNKIVFNVDEVYICLYKNSVERKVFMFKWICH